MRKPCILHNFEPRCRSIISACILGALGINVFGIPSKRTQDIYLCVDAQGNKTFSDHGCDRAGQASHTYVKSYAQSIEFSPLTKFDQARLKQQTQRIKQNRDHRSKQRRKIAVQQQQAKAEAARACDKAKRALIDLQKRKRRGYALGEAASLDAQETKLKHQKSQHC